MNDLFALIGFTPSKSRRSNNCTGITPIRSSHRLRDNLKLVNASRAHLILINFLNRKDITADPGDCLPDGFVEIWDRQGGISSLAVKDIP